MRVSRGKLNLMLFVMLFVMLLVNQMVYDQVPALAEQGVSETDYDPYNSVAKGYWGSNIWRVVPSYESPYYTLMINGIDIYSFDSRIPWDEWKHMIREVHIYSSGIRYGVKPPVELNNSLTGLFSGYENLETVYAEGLDTSDVTHMDYMFADCPSLVCVETAWNPGDPQWDTSKLRDMHSMFKGCSSLSVVQCSGWDVSSVENMADLFKDCLCLERLSLSNWDTSSVNNAEGMFSGCVSLAEIAVGTEYTMCDFPEPTSELGWWSDEDGMWYSQQYIIGRRVGIADTYHNVGSDYRLESVNLMIDDMVLNLLDDEAEVDAADAEKDISIIASAKNPAVQVVRFELYQLDNSERIDIATADTQGVFHSIPCEFFVPDLPVYMDVIGENEKKMYTTKLNLNVIDSNNDCKITAALLYYGPGTGGTDLLTTPAIMDLAEQGDTFSIALRLDYKKEHDWTFKLYQVSESGTTNIAIGDRTATFSSIRKRSLDRNAETYVSVADEKGKVIQAKRLKLTVEDSNEDCELQSVMMSLDGVQSDLLTTVKTIDVLYKNTKFTLTANVKGERSNVRGFTLYQKDSNGRNVIASAASDGRFNLLSYGLFTEDKDVFISVTNKYGKVAHTSQLLLKVIKSEGKIPKVFIAGAGADLSVTLGGDNCGLFDGVRIGLKIGNIPITFKWSTDDTIELGVNYNVSQHNWITVKDMLLATHTYDSSKGDISTFNNIVGFWGVSRCRETSHRVTIVGNLKGSPMTGQYIGEIAVIAELTTSVSRQVYVSMVPVVLEASAKGSGTTTAYAKFNTENDKAGWAGGGVNIRFEGELGLHGRIGLAYIASAGIWGKATLGTNFVVLPPSSSGFVDVYVAGSAGLEAVIMGKRASIPVIEGKKYLYKRGASLTAQSEDVEGSGDAAATMEPMEVSITYEPISRAYAESTTAWDGAVTDNDVSCLQSSVYPDASTQMVEVDGGRLMVFLTDDMERGSGNRSMLVWSRYDAATGVWSDPQPVWQDGTADYSPSICSDGTGGAWLVWSNARDIIGDNASLSQQAALLDIAVAHLDAASDSIDGVQFISDDANVYEALACVGMANGGPVVAWADNPLDDIFGFKGSLGVTRANMENGSWVVRGAGAPGGTITSLAAGNLEGPAVAWAVDGDGATQSVGDSSISVWREDSGTSVVSSASAWNPIFAQAAGQDVLTWCQDGTLTMTKNAVDLVATSLVGLPVISYKVTGDVLGDALVSYVRSEGGAGNVYALRSASGQWGQEVALTSQGQQVTSWTADLADSTPSILYTASTVYDGGMSDTGIWFSGGSATGAATVDGAWYEDGAIHALVSNAGPVGLDGVGLTIVEGDTVVTEDYIQVSLAPGESAEVQVGLSEPTDGMAHTYGVTVSPGRATSTPCEVVVGESMLSMSVTHTVTDGKESFCCDVVNNGQAASADSKVVFRNIETNEVIAEIDFAPLGHGERREVTYTHDGMLRDAGVRSVSVTIAPNDGSSPSMGVTTVVDTWEGPIKNDAINEAPALKALQMYRLYNPNSGEHFYTSNVGECDSLKALGWSCEGIGWYAPEKSSAPVYRLYNAAGGEHHYTMSRTECDALVKAGWKDEGIGWYSDDEKGVELLREYNPNQFSCNHNYTTSRDEHDCLISLGWKDEGSAWYGVKV